jgi:hypothetical protein
MQVLGLNRLLTFPPRDEQVRPLNPFNNFTGLAHLAVNQQMYCESILINDNSNI